MLLMCVYAQAITERAVYYVEGNTPDVGNSSYEFPIGELNFGSAYECGSVSVVFTKVSTSTSQCAAADGYNPEAALRWYKGDKMQVSVANGAISRIEWRIAASSKAAPVASVGTVDGEGTTAGEVVVWTGSASSIDFDSSAGQVRFTQMIVEYDTDGTPTDPIDPIDPSDDPSVMVVYSLMEMNTEGTTYRYMGSATIVARPASDTRHIFVVDESGAHHLYGTNLPAELKAGDVISGFKATMTVYNSLPELIDVSDIAAVGSAGVNIPEVTGAPAPNEVNRLFLLKNFTIPANADVSSLVNGQAQNVNIEIAGQTFVLRNQFKGKFEVTAGEAYDIIFVVYLFNDAIQLVPLEIAPAGSLTALQMIESTGIRYFNNVVYNQNNVRMQVISATGHIVADTTEDFDMNGLAGGVYMVRAKNFVLKIVK